MRYTSNAQWPDCVSVGNTENITTDEHDDLALAQNICRRLEQNGFGGEGKIFPIRTWVDVVEEAPKRVLPVLMSAMAMTGLNPVLSQFLKPYRKKEPKQMGPGAGTNRMKRMAKQKETK